MAQEKELKPADYEQIGRQLVSIHAGINLGKGYYKGAFLRGIVTGFGGIIGATLLVTILLWLLSYFDSLPVIGNFVETIKNSLIGSK